MVMPFFTIWKLCWKLVDMAVVKKIIYVVIFLVVLVYGALFVTQNSQSIALNPVLLPAAEYSLSTVVILAFSIGGLLGMLFSLSMYLKSKGQTVQLSLKLRSAEKELSKFRTVVVKD